MLILLMMFFGFLIWLSVYTLTESMLFSVCYGIGSLMLGFIIMVIGFDHDRRQEERREAKHIGQLEGGR